ncbi:MAG: exodeoxyribonuclease VII large subunit [Clostridia bacterium]|nr:exodeoxyribonuclease VII large subunit [Clostridia bacterium]
MKSPDVLSISQLNFYIKSIIDEDINLRTIFVCAEISNFTNHIKTGHFYMTLKDGKSSIKAVMFRLNAQRLKFMPENGMSVIIRGSVSVFERDGQYQLYIDDMQPDGAGSFNLAFEQLKQRLEKEGLFDNQYKKQIPLFPKKIGVITSPTGAAIKDILNVLERRFPCVEVVVYPVQVQGEQAPIQISTAIRQMSDASAVDVLIVGRGGGSIEELWAFNDELVARSIFDCNIPVISAVGHETDFTICDFVADLRAPTPSAAAELAVPDRVEEQKNIRAIKNICYNLLNSKIIQKRTRIDFLMSKSFMQSPTELINNRRLLLDDYILKMSRTTSFCVSDKSAKLFATVGKLDALSPLKVLIRGYSIATKNNVLISTIDDVDMGDKINVRLSDGIIECNINGVERL